MDLDALHAKHLPRLNWRDVFTITDGELTTEELAALDAYFSHFAVPKGGCVSCGAQQGSKDVMEAFLGKGRFTWGIAHGEGFCADCGYPARAYHFDIGPIKRLELILQYHPDELHRKEQVAA